LIGRKSVRELAAKRDEVYTYGDYLHWDDSEDKPCQEYAAPFDVCLPDADEAENVTVTGYFGDMRFS
jgi:hypothetical protein